MDDTDIWRLAARLIEVYGDGAEMAAAMYADRALAKNDFGASVEWKRTISAIRELGDATRPAHKVMN
jgi:hypothetical protein